MASQIDICNKALIKIGANAIISLSDDTTASNALSAIYDMQRDAELAANPWTFAITRTQLPASGTAPAFGWAYAYPKPSDYLAMVEVGEFYVMYDASQRELFQLEGDSILTDEVAPLNIRYVRRITNTAAFAPLFVEAFACKLAMEIAEKVTQSTSKRQLAAEEYKEAVRLAKRMNAIEQPPRKYPDSSWWAARN